MTTEQSRGSSIARADAAHAVRTERRATLAASAGHFVEWFDWALYGLLAVPLAAAFFPESDGIIGLLSFFVVFGSAFVFRPVGAMVLGSLGDRLGRKKVLVGAVTVMSVATFLVGLLPTTAQAGLVAPALLLLLRVLQGFSAGGEVGGAATYLAESSTDANRAYRVSFIAVSSFVAIAAAGLLILGVRAGLGDEAFAQWGWRIPFLLGAPIGLAALYLRMALSETAKFVELAERRGVERSPLISTLRRSPGAMARSASLVAVQFVASFVVSAYMAAVMTSQLGISGQIATFSTIGANLVAAGAAPLFAILADRRGRRPVIIGGCAGFAVLGYPLFLLATTGVTGAVVAHVAFGLLMASVVGAAMVSTVEQFGTSIRTSGSSIGYNIGAALWGGVTPYLVTLFAVSLGGAVGPTIVVVVSALATLVAAATMRERRGTALGD